MCIIPPVGLSSFGKSGRDVEGDVVIVDTVLVHTQQINSGKNLVHHLKIMSFVYIRAHVEK
jgi:hypothetical protein